MRTPTAKRHRTGGWRCRWHAHQFYGATPAEAIQKALLRFPVPSLSSSDKPVWLAEIIARWLDTQHGVNAKKLAKPFSRWSGENRVPANVPRDALERYQDSLTQAGLAANTIHNRVSAAARILRFGLRNGWLHEMPDRPKPPRQVLRFRDLSRRERILTLRRLLRTNRPVYRACRFLEWTGCRPSELCRIRARDVDLTTTTITLGSHKTAGATGASRAIYMTRPSLEMMRELLRNRTPESQVFRGLSGKPLTWRAIHSSVSRASKTALGYTITPYRFRHTFAQRALAQVPAEDVAKLLGHRGLRYIQVYAQVRDDRAAAVATRLRV